jgi:hypothetical protein
MGKLIMCVLKNIRYNFRELKEELELQKMYDEQRGKKVVPKIYRDGTPQGSPMSPILSTIALENWDYPEGLTIYADDGVYIGEEMGPIKRWILEVATTGVKIAPEKSKTVEGPFNFLGFTLDLKNKILTREDLGKLEYKDLPEEDIIQWIRRGKGIYSNPSSINTKWEWDIAEGSAAEYCQTSLIDKPRDLMITLRQGAFKLEHKK